VGLTILRPSLVIPSAALPARLLSRRLVPTLPGHDPVMQLLSASDVAEAILCAARSPKPGIYNVAPDTVVPLHRAIQLAGRTRLPFPRTLQRAAHSSESLDYLRYPWTISNQKIKRELGFVPQKSSAATLMELNSNNPLPKGCAPHFDEFGMDPDYIRFYSKTLFRLVSDFYWRIEDKGVAYIPARGRALLVGVHRGFMPFDGVMALNTVVRRTGRIPRFLTHPALLKFPFLANFMTKLGGVVACQESADRVLESGEILGIYPEGIHGAFTLYRDAYKLHAFGRDASVEALGRTELVLRRSGVEPRHLSFPPVDSVRANLEAFADAVAGIAPYPIPTSEIFDTVAAFEAITEAAKFAGSGREV